MSLSGGKDSAAASLLLHEHGIAHRRLCMDTGWEHEDTYRYLDEVLEPALGPIDRVAAQVPVLEGYEEPVAEIEAMLGRPSPMVRLCLWKGCFPGQGTRWCTSCLKHEPSALFFEHLDEVVNVVGIRRGESIKRSQAPEWEAMERVRLSTWQPGGARRIELDHVEQFRPLVDWDVVDVVAIHKRHDLPLNPLYRKGAPRVGCLPCIFASKDDIRLLGELDPVRIEVLRLLERLVNDRAQRRRATRKNRHILQPPTWFQARDPVALEALRHEAPDMALPTSMIEAQRFAIANRPAVTLTDIDLDPDYLEGDAEEEEAGEGVPVESRRHLCIPIDRAIEWARTSRGGRQFELFAPPNRDWACSRFGYCETRPAPKGEPGEGEEG